MKNIRIPQEKYNYILENMPIVCVDIAIVNHKNEVLLVKRNDAPMKGQFWLPGGRVFKGEMLRDTAKRKARDEVGLDCHVCSIIHTAETIFPDGPDGIPVHSINTCFYLVTKDSDVQLDSNHEEYKWVSEIEDTFHDCLKDYLRAVWH